MKNPVQCREVSQGLLLLALAACAPGAWSEGAGDVAASHTSMSADFENLRGLLESRGWRVERAPDGSTLLIPLRETAGAQNPVLPEQPVPATVDDRAPSISTAAGCTEERQFYSVTAGVELPVNTRKKAWQISVNWLWESGHRELTVGNIRDINWIYLVTIVDARPPYRPRNELIINKRTGRLLASF